VATFFSKVASLTDIIGASVNENTQNNVVNMCIKLWVILIDKLYVKCPSSCNAIYTLNKFTTFR